MNQELITFILAGVYLLVLMLVAGKYTRKKTKQTINKLYNE